MRKDVINNPRYPHTIKVVRMTTVQKPVDGGNVDDEDPFADDGDDTTKTEQVEEVLYNGKGRAFTDTTTNGTEKVDVNKRKASIPVRYDEWEAAKKPLDGDTLYATIGNNTEIWRVRDCEADNDRTIVYCEFVRV